MYEATKVLSQGGWGCIYVHRGGGCNSVVLKGHHQQQFSFRDPPLFWVFSWICCFKNFTIGKLRFMNARIQLVHHHTTLMLHHIFELLHKHLHLENSIKILSSNNHYNYEMIVYHNLSQILTNLNVSFSWTISIKWTLIIFILIFALNKTYWLKWQIFQHQIHSELLCIIS